MAKCMLASALLGAFALDSASLPLSSALAAISALWQLLEMALDSETAVWTIVFTMQRGCLAIYSNVLDAISQS